MGSDHGRIDRPHQTEITSERGHPDFDTELEHLPPDLRRREWMGRVEAVIFAAAEPVSREVLSKVIGRDCNLDLILDDIRAELKGRPFELVAVAGGFQHRTRRRYADALHVVSGGAGQDNSRTSTRALSKTEGEVLMTIAFFQPLTRGELSKFFAHEISRDLIGGLRAPDLIAFGPRAPQPGAPFTYVTTKTSLSHFGLNTLRDLPDFEALEDAGLLSKEKLLAGDILPEFSSSSEGDVGMVTENEPMCE